MSHRTRVYIAGPISKGDLLHNIRQADEAFAKLLKAGFAPFCPHWSVYHGSAELSQVNGRTISVTAEASPSPAGTTHDDWMGVDLAWVAVADAVLRLPGESKGADAETEEAYRLDIPVYHGIDNCLMYLPIDLQSKSPPKVPAGHPGYLALLDEMRALHCKKAADYGTDADPFANISASEQIGIPAWKAAYLRSRDKMKRIDAYCLKGTLANEGVEDSFMDNAAYNLIALLKFREAKKEPVK